MAKDKASSLAIDFSKFTDEDLEAYEKGETSALSDNALEALANYEDKFNEMASKVGKYKEPEAAPYGLTTAASGTVGALATGIAPRTSQQLVDKMLPEDLRGGYKAPPAAAPVMTKPPVAPAPGADYFSPFGAGEGAVKNATHNVDEVLKNKVAQAAIKTPGYVAPGNSLILQPSSNLPPPTAPVATPGSPVLPGAVKPKMGMPQMRAALQSPNVMPANRLPSSIKGGAAAGFGANAIENAQRGNYGEAATSAIGSGSSLAALASNPKLARAGKLGMAATILGKGYQSMQGREEKAMGGLVGYAGGKAVKGGLEAAKKLVGYLENTPQKQNPLVGKRFEKELVGDLIPKVPLDLEKHRGAMIVPKPWDNTSRGERIKSVSGVSLQNPFETEGGRNWMLDRQHYLNDISGASGFEIANRIHGRVGTASRAGEKQGLSGQVLEMPITMGYEGADFSHHPSSIFIDLMRQKEFNPDVLEQLSNQVRAYNQPGKGQIYKNFVGYGDPRFEEQMFKGGFGLETTPGNLRKTMAHRGMLKENQKLIGFNEEDLRNAITDEALLGVPKGFGGGMFSEGRPLGALTPSQSRIYNTNNPGKYIGSGQEAPIEIWMPEPFGKIKDELSAKYPKKTGNSLRQDVIGALEKRKEGFYQPVNDRVINNIGYYQEGLKEGRFGPNEIEEAIRYVYSKKEGGSVEGYAAGKKVIDAGLNFLKPSAKSHSQDPKVARALEEYLKGNISQEERIAVMNKQLPLRPWTEMPPAYSDEQIKMALMENKRPKALADVPAGARVGNRLDIPAYTQHGVYVDTTHDLAKGNSPISYNRTGHLKDVEFSSKPNQAVRVGLGTKEQALTPMGAEMGSAKSPFALIKGTNQGTSDEEVRRMMAEMMRDPSYAQIGMDPRRHSQFYDKSTGMPVWAAEEKLQSGPLILVPKRGLETTSWDDPRLNLSDFPGKRYAEGGSTTPAWQRSEGKNPEGGLNAAGRASYNRETGGNLKAPQPEGGPRKKSFCARMEGMKKKNTSSATANDPDSRINKSLRKWKC